MNRKSNLVLNSVKTFNPNKQLCRSNIEINSEKNILLINISRSKKYNLENEISSFKLFE